MRRAHDQRMHHYTMGVKRGIAILTAPHVGPSALGTPLRTVCHTRRLFPTFFPPVCRTQARVRHLKERQSQILVALSLLSASPLGREIRRFLGQFTNYCERKHHSFTDQRRYFNTKRRLRAFVALCTLLLSDRTSCSGMLQDMQKHMGDLGSLFPRHTPSCQTKREAKPYRPARLCPLVHNVPCPGSPPHWSGGDRRP